MRTIYTQVKGRFVKVNEPERPNHVNFLIRWRNMDWSGFRTLRECESQIAELEAKPHACDDEFVIVET